VIEVKRKFIVTSSAAPTLDNTNTKRSTTTPVSTYDTLDPSDPTTFGFEQIGTILTPHGIKGELKVKIESDFADLRLKKGYLYTIYID